MPLCLGAIRSVVECKLAVAALVSQMAAPVAVSTIADHVMVESGGNELAIHDDCTPDHRCSATYTPRSLDEAVGIAKQLDAAGHRWSGGLTQIERENFGWLGIKDVRDIFDPRVAIAAEVQFLMSLSQYNTGDKWRGFQNGYVQKVMAQRHVQLDAAVSKPQPVEAPQSTVKTNDDGSANFWSDYLR